MDGEAADGLELANNPELMEKQISSGRAESEIRCLEILEQLSQNIV